MPNRIIKESVCTSEQIDQLTPSAEVLFYRLMVNADDYGRFDARMKMVASKCYPLKSSDIKCIAVDFASLQAAGLISVYEVEGRPYGCFVNWGKHQQIRAKRAKFPDPEDGSEIICNQVISDVPVIQSNPIQSKHEKSETASPVGFAEFWIGYPKKVGKGAAEKAFRRAKIGTTLLPNILQAIERARATEQWRKDNGQFIPNPATWLNERRWEDGATGCESSAGNPLFAGVL